MKLVIVESPAKAKTIGNFLGDDYKVVASYGHIRDLPGSSKEVPEKYKKEKWARLAVNTSKNFEPIYVVTQSSKKHVTNLRKLMKDADELILATDEDREGESISWHLLEVLKPKVPVSRIAFHEITKSAVQQALSNPRKVDDQLVRAQESRRILDRLFGYSLSPVLWKKVRTKLSAGRVQSVAVRLLVEREEARRAFKRAVYWDVEAELSDDEFTFPAALFQVGKQKLASGKDFDADTGALKANSKVLHLKEDQAKRIAELARQTHPWTVTSADKKQTKQRPSPPFITSTLQQAASSAYGFTPRRTMQVAQKLYEGMNMGRGEREGLITYMRTDSTNLSQKALKEAETYIVSEFGPKYHQGTRVYSTKAKSAQEAHEAIRPTVMGRTPDSVAKYLSDEELKLYSLIWRRAIASQMADAQLEKTTLLFEVKTDQDTYTFKSTGSIVKFRGYLAVIGSSKNTLLPELSVGDTIGPEQKVKVVDTEALRHETSPPGRYTEASLVRKLEEEGIGRPSTYAPTIATIQQRGYAAKKGSALLPTYLGIAVTHLLREHFPQYIDYGFTARMEDQLDSIAEGDEDWKHFLTNFYFGENEEPGLETTIGDETPRIDYPSLLIGEDEADGKAVYVRIGRNSAYVTKGDDNTGTRAYIEDIELPFDELTLEIALERLEGAEKGNDGLGQDSETGKTVYAFDGPYGPYVQLGQSEGKDKPLRVSLPKGMPLTDVTLSFACELISSAKRGREGLGEHPETGDMVYLLEGPFGPYVQLGEAKKGEKPKRSSLPKGITPNDVDMDLAVKLLSLPRELGEHPESGKPIVANKGRFGPYISHDGDNRTIPKTDDVYTIGLERALEVLAMPKGKKPAKKKTTRKKTTKKS